MEEKDLALARRLVDVDKKARGRALKKFRQWLNAKASLSLLQSADDYESTKGVFTEIDMLKIMRAIYFCMWHADKPLIQEELAANLASLIHIFKRIEDTMLFVTAFFETIQQQWSNIDKLRLDKFYLLIREMLKQCFKHLSNNGWSDRAIDLFANALQTHPLELITEYISDGVKLHIIDIYIDELFKSYRNIPMLIVIRLIDPFRLLATKCPNKLIRQVTISNIFERICSMIEKGKGDNLFANKSTYEDYISKMATNKGTLESCRNKLYGIKHKLLIMPEPVLSTEDMELPSPDPPVHKPADESADQVEEIEKSDLSDGIVDNTSSNIEDIDLDGDEATPEDGDFANELDALVGETETISDQSLESTSDLENGIMEPENNNESPLAKDFITNVKPNKKRKRRTKANKKNSKELHIIIHPPSSLEFKRSRSLEDVNSALGAWYNEEEFTPSTPSPLHEYTPSKKKRVTFSGEQPYVREFRKGSSAMQSPDIIAFEKNLTPVKSILKSCMEP
ncbi:Ribosomal RNA processing protein 1-like protein A-like isoform X1 [Oopsacas minuta]|uniref:Ribosomal RNA processing protein 1-like protein A-like isoform X1 n=1 Tax=Oopsacas minuta TaxID=111878 RepID=A0AAV7JTZ9_9METZ|nr:Ribosomal RNA processing protein 1-like protein A-like isoform X1 [Oopsacas minuta]